jgi:hypothetical protein
VSAKTLSLIEDFRHALDINPKLFALFAGDVFTPTQFAFAIYCLSKERLKNPQKVLLPEIESINRPDLKNLLAISGVYSKLALVSIS